MIHTTAASCKGLFSSSFCANPPVGPPKRERAHIIHVHHHIPRTGPRAKRNKERVDKRGVPIDDACALY